MDCWIEGTWEVLVYAKDIANHIKHYGLADVPGTYSHEWDRNAIDGRWTYRADGTGHFTTHDVQFPFSWKIEDGKLCMAGKLNKGKGSNPIKQIDLDHFLSMDSMRSRAGSIMRRIREE